MKEIFKNVVKEINSALSVTYKNLYCELDYFDNKSSIIVYRKQNKYKYKKTVYIIDLKALSEAIHSVSTADLSFISYYVISKHVKGE